jgi:hypothetical protein
MGSVFAYRNIKLMIAINAMTIAWAHRHIRLPERDTGQ